MSGDGEPARPLLRVVRGEPSPEELAALVAVLTARSAAAAGAADRGRRRPVSGWTDHSRLMRRALVPGPGAWRASAQPLR